MSDRRLALAILLVLLAVYTLTYSGVFHSDDFTAQTRQALQNLVDVLREAGGKPEHIVRLTWYVTDKREYLAAGRGIGQAFRELIGSYNAAMTAVQVAALMEDRAKVEIEATAVIPVS